MRAFSYAWTFPRSRDKDGFRIIQSVIAEIPTLQGNCMRLCFIEPELLPIEVLHCGDRNFRPFLPRDLDFNQMTFIYELNPYSLGLAIYRMCESELPMRRLSKVTVLQTYIQTYRQTDIRHRLIQRRFVGGQK